MFEESIFASNINNDSDAHYTAQQPDGNEMFLEIYIYPSFL